MATRKLPYILGGCAALLVLVALIAAVIAGTIFYSIGHSEAARTAKDYLRRNEKLRSDVGDVQDFGWLVSGHINVQTTDGDATLRLKVIGSKRTAPAYVRLAYRDGRDWRVVGASYEAADGRIVSLFDPYALVEQVEGATPNASADTHVAGFDEEGFKANVLEAEDPVLVFVGAPANEESKQVEDVLEGFEGRRATDVSVIRYNVQEQPGVLSRLHVQTIPTLVMFLHGQERERLSGAHTAQEITAMVDKYLAPPKE
jgi:thioredoxin 1